MFDISIIGPSLSLFGVIFLMRLIGIHRSK